MNDDRERNRRKNAIKRDGAEGETVLWTAYNYLRLK